MKFPLGATVMTASVNDWIEGDPVKTKLIATLLGKHAKGDWGDLDPDDWKANDAALKSGDGRLFSNYNWGADTKIWIITEWDRSVTTVLFPSDY